MQDGTNSDSDLILELPGLRSLLPEELSSHSDGFHEQQVEYEEDAKDDNSSVGYQEEQDDEYEAEYEPAEDNAGFYTQHANEEQVPAVSITENAAQGGEAGTDEEPLYVNAKQYHRILKRRQIRQRLEELNRISKERKVSAEATAYQRPY